MKYTVLILTALFILASCADTPEVIAARAKAADERHQYELQRACVLKHGSPVMDDKGRFKDCNYHLKGTIKKE